MGEYILEIVLFIVGLGLIVKGADWFTEAAVGIAQITHIPRVVIGATIVSLATTMPEFFVSATAAFMGGEYCAMAVGNAIGSCLCNIGFALGSCVLIKAFSTHPRLSRRQGSFMLGCGLLLWALAGGKEVSRGEGLVLVGLLFFYFYYALGLAKTLPREGNLKQGISAPSGKLSREIGWFILGAICLGVGSRLLLTSGAKIAEALGISRLIISLSLIAIGTSLPEWVTALTAALKGYQQLSVGNIMGANILDILWVIGISAVIHPLPIQVQTKIFDLPVMLGLMVLLVIFSTTKNRLSHWEGGILFGGYLGYLGVVFTYFR